MQAQFHSHTDDTDSLQTVSEVLHWSEIFSDQLLIFYKPVFTAQGAEKKIQTPQFWQKLFQVA